MDGIQDRAIEPEADPEQDAVLRRAAEARGESANDFVLRHAVEAAEMELADRRVFVVDDAAEPFQDLLSAPPSLPEAIVKLLSNPSVLERPGLVAYAGPELLTGQHLVERIRLRQAGSQRVVDPSRTGPTRRAARAARR